MDPQQVPIMNMPPRSNPSNLPPPQGPPNFRMGPPPIGGPTSSQPMMPFMPGPPLPQESKQKHFASGVYVSGFEKTLTAAMLQDHFKIKPIEGLKLPLTKFQQNKGFAFIYYRSQDDASFVKRELDHSVILMNEIRVTRIVVAENLSKMIFKMNVFGLSADDIKQNEALYFNEKTLEKQTQKIIQREFNSSIEINKIVIPQYKEKKERLRYARVFFYVRDLRDAVRIVKLKTDPTSDLKSNDYEIVLAYIQKILNEDPDFRKFAKSEIYQYAKKNQSNILHIKGIKANANENPDDLARELKDFIQDQNKQANILNCYASLFQQQRAWANVTFSTHQEAKDAFDHFKNNLAKFRDTRVYASMKNYRDNRTVVISTVRAGATETDMGRFLTELAAESQRVDQSDEEKGRKFDFFSFNIIEKKNFFIDAEGISVAINDDQEANKQWRKNNQVPRRVIIHFIHDVNENDLRELVNAIRVNKKHQEIFMNDNKFPLRANHQKGHINPKNRNYTKHFDMKGKPKKQRERQHPASLPRTNIKKPTGAAEFSLRNKGGMPNMPIKKNMPGGNFGGSQPPMRVGGAPSSKLPMGTMPPNFMANKLPPTMGQQPPMGHSIPPMGQGMPPMGQGVPPMGQQQPMRPPMGQGIPPMGQGIPPMGQGMPPMGQQIPKPKPM